MQCGADCKSLFNIRVCSWHDINLKEYCAANNILVEGYAPMADYPRSNMLNDTTFVPLAQKYGVTVAQLVMQVRWTVRA